MIKIKTEKDISQADICHILVCCPECGQKLTDVTYLRGVAILRLKCRRCKKYINVDLTGDGDSRR